MDYSNFNVEDFLTDESFINYCYGADETDDRHWENVILTQPLLRKNINEARELCLLLGVRVSKADKQQALYNLKSAIKAETFRAGKPKTTLLRKIWLPRIAVAASLFVLVISFGLLRYKQPVSGALLFSHVNAGTYHQVAQSGRSRKNFILPDGTTVTLNGLSTLSIANDYNKDDRHVVLTGEAFFEVKKDKTRPFVVLTGRTATTALGTSFKVSGYESSKSASVMLATGKVKVEATKLNAVVKPEILTPGQQVILTDGKNQFAVSNYDRVGLQDWLNSKLTFTNANFQEISTKLFATYGIHVVAENKIAAKIRFTGQFSNKNIADVLEAIGFVNNFRYKQNGNAIQILYYN